MTRDEALKAAWKEIFSCAESMWEDDFNEGEFFSPDDYVQLDNAVWDILRHPTEYTAWIE